MKKRIMITYLVMTLLLILLMAANICMGSVSIRLSEIWGILSGSAGDTAQINIVMNIRLPRMLEAVFLGAALSVSGFMLQTFFGNPIAGPYVLGISSGAKLTVAIAMIFLLDKGIAISSFGMVISAFVGSMAAMGFVLILSGRIKNMSMLVIIGIMIGYICSAVTDFCVTFADDSNIVNLHNWSLGSFSGSDWSDLSMIIPIVCVCLASAFLLSKPISAFQLGENYARNMGVNIKALKVLLILISSILSACVTAFAGPISFVGIAVPHLIRMAFGSSKPTVIIPGCMLGGAVITLFCDGIARTVFAPTEISISSVTAVFLVPVVIVMMVKRQRRMQ